MTNVFLLPGAEVYDKQLPKLGLGIVDHIINSVEPRYAVRFKNSPHSYSVPGWLLIYKRGPTGTLSEALKGKTATPSEDTPLLTLNRISLLPSPNNQLLMLVDGVTLANRVNEALGGYYQDRLTVKDEAQFRVTRSQLKNLVPLLGKRDGQAVIKFLEGK